MKNVLCSVVFLFAVSLAAWSQTDRSLLWKVSNANGQLEGYLYGTIHVSDSRVTAWDEHFFAAFSQCNLLLAELDMKSDEFENADLLSALVMEDTLLTDLYTPKEWQVVNDTLRTYFPDSLTFSFMTMMYPLLVEAAVSQMRSSSAAINDAGEFSFEVSEDDKSLVPDIRLQDLALERGNEVRGIETVDDQLSLFRKGGAHAQAQSLLRTITEYKGESSTTEEWDEAKLIEKYLEQDVVFFQSIINVQNLGGTMYHYLFEKRNKVMHDAFIASFSDGVPFCAVGAGHLSGKDGILELLVKSGYRAEPVVFSFVK